MLGPIDERIARRVTVQDGTQWRRLLPTVVVIGILVVAVVAAGSAAASEPAAEPSLVVELKADGDATVAVTHTFDLTAENEHAAFKSLEADAETRDATRDRFEDRMANVAADAGDVTDRDMTVENATISLETEADESRGVVTMAVTWTALADRDEDRLIITEPFASGTTFDRPLRIVVPDGYTIETATPAPDTADGSTMTWDAETDLGGFEATLAMNESAGNAEAVESQPGFGPVTVMIALVGGMIALYHSQRTSL